MSLSVRREKCSMIGVRWSDSCGVHQMGHLMAACTSMASTAIRARRFSPSARARSETQETAGIGSGNRILAAMQFLLRGSWCEARAD